MNRSHLLPPFDALHLPPWNCPNCQDGVLESERTSLRKEESAESARQRHNDGWDPEWEVQYFSVLLRCVRCREPVFGVGRVETREAQWAEHGWDYVELLNPSYFEPPIPLVPVPLQASAAVKNEVMAASKSYWSSPSTAANRLRAALERLMDDLKIPKKTKTTRRTYASLTLHARLEKFAARSPETGEMLMAVKWLGNTGSHSDDLTHMDALDGFELIETAVREIYDQHSERLKSLSERIVKKKGPARR